MIVPDGVSTHYASVRLTDAFRVDVAALVESSLTDELASIDQLKRDLSTRLKQLSVKEDALMDLVGEPDWPQDKLNARMQALRLEREGIERQLADIHTALDGGREVLTYGLRLLSSPRAQYDAGSDIAKGVLTKEIFTRLYLDGDEERHVSVARHELAAPFDALKAAETTWRQGQASVDPVASEG